MSISMQLYIIGGVEILLPILVLIFLRKTHKYRISSVISGIGSYFLATNILMGMFSMLMSSVGLTIDFWKSHETLYNIINMLLNVVLQNVTLYLVMKLVLKSQIRIYDAIAIGISYWLGNALMLSTSSVSYARIASMSLEGRLNEMVTENLSLETLQEYAAELDLNGISSFYLQMLAVFVLSIMTAVLCIFLFHAIKRKNKGFFWLALGGHLVLLTLLNLSLTLGGNMWYLAANIVVAGISIAIFILYWKWYKTKQMDLLKKKQEYKQRLKAAGGNVVSVQSLTENTEE